MIISLEIFFHSFKYIYIKVIIKWGLDLQSTYNASLDTHFMSCFVSFSIQFTMKTKSKRDPDFMSVYNNFIGK